MTPATAPGLRAVMARDEGASPVKTVLSLRMPTRPLAAGARGRLPVVRRQLAVLALLAALGPAAAGPASDPAASKCTPAPNEVAVFAEARHAGACRLLKAGVYATPGAIGLGPAGVGSVKVPSRMRAQLCGFDGRGEVRCGSPWHDVGRVALPASAPVSFVKVLDESGPRESCELGPGAQDEFKVALLAVVGGPGGGGVTLCLKLPARNYPNAAAIGLIDPPAMASIDPKALDRLRTSGQVVAARDVTRIIPGRRAVVRICSKPDFAGDCRDLRGGGFGHSAPPLASMRVGADWECRLGAGTQALLYAEDAAWGRCSMLGAGDFPTLKSLRLDGAAARTLKLAKDATATACNAENLQGDCLEVPPGATIDGTDLRSLQLRPVAPNPVPPGPVPAASALGT